MAVLAISATIPAGAEAVEELPEAAAEMGELDLYDPSVYVITEELEPSSETGEEPTAAEPTPEPVPELIVTPKQMLVNLRASKCLGAKRDVVIGVMKVLIRAGAEPAFAAGVGANILAEGTYGLFERSGYEGNSKARPEYFCYLDGGAYYAYRGGAYTLIAEYLSQEEVDGYTGEAEARLRYGEENFYLDNYSGRYAQQVNLTELEALLEELAEDDWHGKFGLGIVQWTGAHTQALVRLYRKHAGEGDTITTAQVVAAENEMILSDFKGGYRPLYDAWKAANSGTLDTDEAARSAAEMVCTGYERPVHMYSKAKKRGDKAAEMYRIMAGLQL